jgi:hypothetical protein
MKSERRMFFAWQLDKEKAYLEDKAKEGLHLKQVLFGKYLFEEGEGKDVTYQFDFRVLNKKDEAEYLDMYQDWELVQRYGGWYYFRKDEVDSNNQIFCNVESVKKMLERLMGFLMLVGFPLYYQLFILFPTLSRNDEWDDFYSYFMPIVMVFFVLHLFSMTRILAVYIKLKKEIRE